MIHSGMVVVVDHLVPVALCVMEVALIAAHHGLSSTLIESPTTDSVEMRLCKPYSIGTTPIEVIELYV